MAKFVEKSFLSHDLTTEQRPKLGSPEKRLRHHDELEQQARTFGQDWRMGDRVMTWLNRHEGRARELSGLVEDGWSWADIGRAMHLAGITYRTGQSISASILRKKASEARASVRAKSDRTPDATSPNTEVPVVSPVQQQAAALSSPASISPPLAKTDFPTGDEETGFKPATLIRHNWKKQLEALFLHNRASVPVRSPPIDVDAVLARFTGRK